MCRQRCRNLTVYLKDSRVSCRSLYSWKSIGPLQEKLCGRLDWRVRPRRQPFKAHSSGDLISPGVGPRDPGALQGKQAVWHQGFVSTAGPPLFVFNIAQREVERGPASFSGLHCWAWRFGGEATVVSCVCSSELPVRRPLFLHDAFFTPWISGLRRPHSFDYGEIRSHNTGGHFGLKEEPLSTGKKQKKHKDQDGIWEWAHEWSFMEQH